VPSFTLEDMATELVVCRECHLGRLAPMPSSDEIRAFYPDEYYGESERKFERTVELLVRLVGERHARFLSRGLRPGARVLDVGCGRGVHLAALADRGFEVHGFEVSGRASRGIDPRAKLAIAPDLAQVGYPGRFFDQVILWHVLEHLRDPVGTLREVRRVLRPGGRLIVAVPNFGSLQARWAGPAWFHLDPPRHLYHFTVPVLRRLVETADFRIRSEHHFSLRQNPFGWVQSALNRSERWPRNALYVLLQESSLHQADRLTRSTRRALRLAYLAGMPIGLALAILEALARSGATIHLVAHAGRSASSRS
jgi:2-polyprenyl-3-methyl-5-hydroxy-6-metoxy-1,4-benzoquinol methylase